MMEPGASTICTASFPGQLGGSRYAVMLSGRRESELGGGKLMAGGHNCHHQPVHAPTSRGVVATSDVAIGSSSWNDSPEFGPFCTMTSCSGRQEINQFPC